MMKSYNYIKNQLWVKASFNARLPKLDATLLLGMLRVKSLSSFLLVLCCWLIYLSANAQAPPTWEVQSDYFGQRDGTAQPRTTRGMALSQDGLSVYTGLIQSPNTGSTSLRKVSSEVLAVPGTDHVIFGNGMPGGTGTFAQVGGQPVYDGGSTGTFQGWRNVGNSPEGIATDDRGNVYVALTSGITNANRIDIFNSDLSNQVGTISLGGNPRGVRIHKIGSTYYAYTISDNGLQRYDVTNVAGPTLDATYTPGVFGGKNLAIDLDGTVYVAGNDQVRRISATGTLTHTSATITAAKDVSVYYNKVYVIKDGSPSKSISVLNKADMTSAGVDLTVPDFGITRSTISQFKSVDVNAQGNLYISEENYNGTQFLSGGYLSSYTPPVTTFNPTPGAITGRIYFDRVVTSSFVEPDYANIQVTVTDNSAEISYNDWFSVYSLDGVNYSTPASNPFTITDLEPGSYTVYIKDGVGNISTETFIIEGPKPVRVYSDTGETFLVSSHTTIQAAIDAATTLSGYVVRVDADTFTETVTVNKQLDIRGAGNSTIITNPGGTAITYAANGSGTDSDDRAYLKNVKISGSTKGILVADVVNYLTLDGVIIDGNSSFGIHVNNVSGILKDWVITNSTFNANSDGFRMDMAANLDGLTINGTTFTDQVGSAIYIPQQSSSPGGFSNVTITDNTFTNNAANSNNNAALYIEKMNNAFISGNTLTNNGFNGLAPNARAIIVNLKFGSYSNIEITGNTIIENRNPVASLTKGYGLYFASGPGSPAGTLSGLKITNNEIDGFWHAIELGAGIDRTNIQIKNNKINNVQIGVLAYSATSSSGTQITENSFTNLVGATPYAIATGDAAGTPIAATCNWFGSADLVLFENLIVGDVNFVPFLINGTDNDLTAIGFQPVPNSCLQPITVTADDLSKFCGQSDPAFTFQITEGELAEGDVFTGSLEREPGETAGTYAITQGTLILEGYSITFIPGVFEINGITVDASASSTPVQLGSTATLSAQVSPAVSGVSVSFYLDGVLKGSGLTNGFGVATLPVSGLALNVYKVEAKVGTCASSEAYLPVFDPNGSFVTGGGWINSPAGAMPANPTTIGKANFGFVSKYKKGSSQVDGNTEFQFNAGGLNFKSTMYESGSLVISGRRATYRGTGTINGQSGFKFVVVAIDGNWNGQTNPDAFRIKISTTSGEVIYDNRMGSAENTEDASILGGGSIVIHEAKGKGNKRIEPGSMEDEMNSTFENNEKELVPNTIRIYPNPASEVSNIQVNLYEGSGVTLRVFDVAGRLVMEEQSYQERSFTRTLELKGLSNGLYHVVVQVGNQVMTKRLVKK